MSKALLVGLAASTCEHPQAACNDFGNAGQRPKLVELASVNSERFLLASCRPRLLVVCS